ncbi:unnamed protein product [Acanthosepion pharaonis]|uniref:Uncharacterized protein n=1 Tax=Acanthosepion pharaonis TaxID=158019 RepID=A0A812DD91_ACAPH|nr:unnamed protein product [Sepia pharaonis]
MVRKPLTPNYTGPHQVISRAPKYFVIDLAGKQTTVSIDRLPLSKLQIQRLYTNTHLLRLNRKLSHLHGPGPAGAFTGQQRSSPLPTPLQTASIHALTQQDTQYSLRESGHCHSLFIHLMFVWGGHDHSCRFFPPPLMTAISNVISSFAGQRV